MALLTRDQIVQAEDVETREVPVPEWGGSVLVRGLTGTERDAYEASIVDTRGKTARRNFTNMRAKLLAKCLVDDKGQRLFGDADVIELGKKSGAVLDRLFDLAAEMSGLAADSDEEAEGN